jgi:hypothetical protein
LERRDEFIGAAANQGVAVSTAGFILSAGVADSNDARLD